MSQNVMTAEQIKAQAEAEGRKLGMLLASLEISRETLEAILAVLPSLTLEQLEKFSALLTDKYANALAGDIDNKLKRDLENINTAWKQEVAATDEQTITELAEVTKDLN